MREIEIQPKPQANFEKFRVSAIEKLGVWLRLNFISHDEYKSCAGEGHEIKWLAGGQNTNWGGLYYTSSYDYHTITPSLPTIINTISHLY